MEQEIGCDILIESRVAPATLKELEQKGHKFKVRKEYSTAMGRGQAVLHNSKTQHQLRRVGPAGRRVGGTRASARALAALPLERAAISFRSRAAWNAARGAPLSADLDKHWVPRLWVRTCASAASDRPWDDHWREGERYVATYPIPPPPKSL